VRRFRENARSLAKKNFSSRSKNKWFKSEFVELKKEILNLPIEDESIDIAQNCLLIFFKTEDLKKALQEMYRVLKPHGRLVMSDPTMSKK
jgi:ubiquinone/menaquinone biosynthesis C-methylase UbiE